MVINNINEYECFKIISAVIFNTEKIIDVDNYPWIYEKKGLLAIKEFVEIFTEQGYFSDIVINNVNEVLFKARSIKSENQEEKINIINEIIRKLNSQEIDNSTQFYRYELFKRRKDQNYIDSYPDYIVEEDSRIVNTSICFDLTFLSSHLDYNFSEEQFDQVIEALGNSPYYFESLNALLQEFPLFFTDKVFLKRVIKVLELKLNLTIDRKIKRKTKKVISALKVLTNGES